MNKSPAAREGDRKRERATEGGVWEGVMGWWNGGGDKESEKRGKKGRGR